MIVYEPPPTTEDDSPDPDGHFDSADGETQSEPLPAEVPTPLDPPEFIRGRNLITEGDLDSFRRGEN